MKQPPVRTVAPVARAVSLSRVKAHLRVTHADDDERIAALIDAATERLDGWSGILGRCLVTQTWRQDFDGFPGADLRLPFPDVQSAAVSYRDTAGDEQVFSGFAVVHDGIGSKLVLNDGQTWPDTAVRPDAVQVTMVCGYAEVPEPLRRAIMLDVQSMFDGPDEARARAWAALIAPYRRVGF